MSRQAPRRALSRLALTLVAACCAPTWASPVRAEPKPGGATPTTVAILYFDYTGKDESLGVLRKGLAQMLISELSDVQTVRIVERDRLEEVLAELKLSRSKGFDKKTAARVGKLLGARYLVLGNYFDLMGMLRVDARVVAVETGAVVRSVGASGKAGDFLSVEGQVSAGLRDAFENALPPADDKVASEGGEPKQPQTKKQRKKAPGKRPTGKIPAHRTKPKRPKRLDTPTAIEYARALDAADAGDTKKAREGLQKVIKKQPDFQLAALDLAALAR